MFKRLALVALVVVFPFVAVAEEKAKVTKPTGTFVREIGERKLTFTFKDDDLTITVKLGEASMVINCAYGVTKDGLLFAAMTKVEKKGTEGGPTKGDLFSAQYVIKKGELTLSEFKSTHGDEEARRLVEGVYKEEK
jgi:hypothetical protein